MSEANLEKRLTKIEKEIKMVNKGISEIKKKLGISETETQETPPRPGSGSRGSS